MKNSIRFLIASVAVYLIVVVIGAFAVLECECGAACATIRTVSDALWWAVNMSSVGDAEISPVTNAGRIVGGVLCLVGSALFTVNVGIIAGIVTHVIRKEECWPERTDTDRYG